MADEDGERVYRAIRGDHTVLKTVSDVVDGPRGQLEVRFDDGSYAIAPRRAPWQAIDSNTGKLR